MVLITLLGSVGAAVLALVGIRALVAFSAERRRSAAHAADYTAETTTRAFVRADRRFRRTRVGRLIERELALAGIDRRPLALFLIAVAVAVVAAYILWTALAPLLSVFGLAAGVFGLRAFLERAKDRRLQAFILQMPELARVLANATNAGLSIQTAISLAADELAPPAKVELQHVADALRFGTDLESALDTMGERLPSREVAVLVSTMIVCARSGGSLVTSLRDIAETLEERKETRREVRTTLAQSVATGYTVIVLGIGILFLLNALQPGSVRAMTVNPIGQIALLVSAGLFVGGFMMIRRMTRIDV
ncbi:type II secretion system F family protein [Nocardioides sp. Kera G14]|uniref:type II secretion system F family protein n=1 Tax=Nocardioides sp. Kera G14 TaxID=2884264 RepID=UPI001D12EE28|nr:type II secretion system F family protein [Nocardioides sp. Kera G14]UDY23764.1 type II secretion system F family protein [Nocardioides sp. Kera G14]